MINQELPDNAKVLLVGEARALYVRRNADYYVAFNRNPLLEMVHDAVDAPAMMDRLREKGYTHVLVNWSEIRRLERTYGLAPPQPSRGWSRRSRVSVGRGCRWSAPLRIPTASA